MKKKLVLLGVSLGFIFMVLIAIILTQNTFDMTIKTVKIPTSKGSLNGSLVLPKNNSLVKGIVVFIHGDGPANASYNDGYLPLWEVFSKEGYASISWSKPGINGSDGNWLTQSMDDRATEAEEVIQWVKTLPEFTSAKIGLWGSSQAGWVIPKIVQLDSNISFSILVAPAVNWLDQGLYNTLAELKYKGASKAKLKIAYDKYEWSVSMLNKNTSYKNYISQDMADKSISEDRWSFILKNYRSDSTDDLTHIYSPIKLFLGGKDRNVDSNNTEKIYKEQVPEGLLQVTVLPKTNHFMLKANLVDNNVMTYLIGLFTPRKLLDSRYYNGIKDFIRSIK